jgi:hypothetical protein
LRSAVGIIAQALGICRRGSPLESVALATIFDSQGLTPPAPGEYARVPYPFVSDGVDGALAADAMAAAVAMLIEEPAIDAAIEEATARFDMGEQQRLLSRKRELAERLRDVTARARV